MAVYIQLCVTVAVAVKENDLCACLWSDGEEGQWCRALILSVHDSMVNITNGRMQGIFWRAGASVQLYLHVIA